MPIRWALTHSREGVRTVSQDGLTPAEQLERINAEAEDLMADQQAQWRDLAAELSGQGLSLVSPDSLSDADKAALGSSPGQDPAIDVTGEQQCR